MCPRGTWSQGPKGVRPRGVLMSKGVGGGSRCEFVWAWDRWARQLVCLAGL